MKKFILGLNTAKIINYNNKKKKKLKIKVVQNLISTKKSVDT